MLLGRVAFIRSELIPLACGGPFSSLQ